MSTISGIDLQKLHAWASRTDFNSDGKSDTIDKQVGRFVVELLTSADAEGKLDRVVEPGELNAKLNAFESAQRDSGVQLPDRLSGFSLRQGLGRDIATVANAAQAKDPSFARSLTATLNEAGEITMDKAVGDLLDRRRPTMESFLSKSSIAALAAGKESRLEEAQSIVLYPQTVFSLERLAKLGWRIEVRKEIDGNGNVDRSKLVFGVARDGTGDDPAAWMVTEFRLGRGKDQQSYVANQFSVLSGAAPECIDLLARAALALLEGGAAAAPSR